MLILKERHTLLTKSRQKSGETWFLNIGLEGSSANVLFAKILIVYNYDRASEMSSKLCCLEASLCECQGESDPHGRRTSQAVKVGNCQGEEKSLWLVRMRCLQLPSVNVKVRAIHMEKKKKFASGQGWKLSR